MDIFLEALSQCSYLRLAIGLDAAVKLEMLPTLELLFKYCIKLCSVFWNSQVKQFVLIHQQNIETYLKCSDVS